MTNKTVLLFCDNEHGVGEPCFPDVDKMDGYDVKQMFIKGASARALRQEAKKAGWSRVNGGDYCPICTESGI
jgi:hypothetical protein